jgi:hypothetical protein
MAIDGERCINANAGRPPSRSPSNFFFAVGTGDAWGVAVPCAVDVGPVTGVIGPGVGGVTGAFAFGAVNEETARIASNRTIERTTTVKNARSIPRRGFGCGLLATAWTPVKKLNAPV